MAYQPGDIVNRHILNASATRWEPLRYASNWDRWAAFGIGLADYTRRREGADDTAALLWTDCFGVFGKIRMTCSAALSAWRKTTLTAQFLTLPGNQHVQGSMRRRVAWSSFHTILGQWIRLAPHVMDDIQSSLPASLAQVVIAQTELMLELTPADVGGRSGRGRFTWEQSTTALRITAHAALRVPVVEAWMQADDPLPIFGLLDGYVSDPTLTILAEDRAPVAGRTLRDIKDVVGDPLDLVTQANLSLYPDYLFAVGRVG
ncbi:MAG: hypothetical protein E6Q91_01115 [Actinobacteria bacterium]|nr:MAG: hypothetical protein E6Q91_01115 [Actinomycetota bacterium]